MSAKLAIFAVVVFAASVASASTLRSLMGSKGGFEFPQQPLVQGEFRQPQIVQQAAPIQQLSYQAPIQASYPTKGGLDYQQTSYQAPVKSAEIVQAPQLPMVQSYSAPAVQTEFRQPELIQSVAPVHYQAPMRASYPTKGGLDYQQTSYQAPVKGEFRQPELIQSVAPVHYQAPMRASYPTKGGLDYQQTSYQAPVKSAEIVQAPQQPLVQSYSAPAVQTEFRQPEIVQSSVAPVELPKVKGQW